MRLVGNACYHSSLIKEQADAGVPWRAPCIVVLKAIARSYIWWLNLNEDDKSKMNLNEEIELMVKGYEVYQSVRKAAPAAPLHPWKWPRIHTDFSEKAGNYFLGLIDSHS